MLIDHIALTYHELKVSHPESMAIVAGDRNDIKIDDLLSISHNFQQIVDKPTRKGRILDVVVTDMAHVFQPVVLLRSIGIDEGKSGVPYDHSGVLVRPQHQ